VSSSEESETKPNRTDSETSTSLPKPPPSPPPQPLLPPADGKKRLTEELDESSLKDYKERIDKFMVQFRAASENGLFYRRREFEKKGINPSKRVDDILTHIIKARSYLHEKDLASCEYSLARAEDLYFETVYTRSRSWRFNNVYAFHLWLYFMVMIFSIFTIYISLSEAGLIYRVEVGGEPLVFGVFPILGAQAVIWGMVGGLLQDIWYLWRHVHNRDYRTTWIIQYYSAPFIGGILGAIVYIIIVAGLIVLDTDTSGTPRDFVVMGLAAFAGWNWEWAIKRFETLGAKFQD
jgi:hypothetical protein